MKIKLGMIAMVLFGMNLISCSPNSISEEDERYEIQATEGDDGSDEDKPGN